MFSKRGQEMSISTLVLIVLAVIVLVLIVIGATGGFTKIGDLFSNLGGGKSNIQTVLQGCQVACQTNSQYDYCTREREIRTGGDTSSGLTDKRMYTCDALVARGITGLDRCASITCPPAVPGPPAP